MALTSGAFGMIPVAPQRFEAAGPVPQGPGRAIEGGRALVLEST
jgi:hypothetical protein